MVSPLGAHVFISSKPKLGTRNLAWIEISSSGGEFFPKLNQKLGWRRKANSSSLAERGGSIFDADTRWWYISDWWNISNFYEFLPKMTIFKTKYGVSMHSTLWKSGRHGQGLVCSWTDAAVGRTLPTFLSSELVTMLDFLILSNFTSQLNI